jgi:hypothetical protein
VERGAVTAQLGGVVVTDGKLQLIFKIEVEVGRGGCAGADWTVPA